MGLGRFGQAVFRCGGSVALMETSFSPLTDGRQSSRKFFFLKSVVPNWGGGWYFAPRGTMGYIWRHFGLSQLEG